MGKEKNLQMKWKNWQLNGMPLCTTHEHLSLIVIPIGSCQEHLPQAEESTDFINLQQESSIMSNVN